MAVNQTIDISKILTKLEANNDEIIGKLKKMYLKLNTDEEM